MRIFSSAYIQCNKLENVLDKVVLRQANARSSKGEYRAAMSKALAAPMKLRYDELLVVVSVYLMENMGIEAEEYTSILLRRLLAEQDIYGDSLAYPVRAFTDTSILDQINLKIDDKLCIVYNSKIPVEEETYMDIACYIILYKTIVSMSDKRFYQRVSGMDLIKRGGTIIVAVLIACVLWSTTACMVTKNKLVCYDIYAILLGILALIGLYISTKNRIINE